MPGEAKERKESRATPKIPACCRVEHQTSMPGAEWGAGELCFGPTGLPSPVQPPRVHVQWGRGGVCACVGLARATWVGSCVQAAVRVTREEIALEAAWRSERRC